jgi:hypothetical protein
MADPEKIIQVDDDWKAEAQREKERLTTQEESDVQKPKGDVGFLGLVELLTMQAVVSLGGMQGPSGEPIPPNPEAAKHFIDMLSVLEEKTKGNLTDDEKKRLDTVLYELRMGYVQMTGGGGTGTPSAPPKAGETGAK